MQAEHANTMDSQVSSELAQQLHRLQRLDRSHRLLSVAPHSGHAPIPFARRLSARERDFVAAVCALACWMRVHFGFGPIRWKMFIATNIACAGSNVCAGNGRGTCVRPRGACASLARRTGPHGAPEGRGRCVGKRVRREHFVVAPPLVRVQLVRPLARSLAAVCKAVSMDWPLRAATITVTETAASASASAPLGLI